jgi:hypothetical protein
MRTVEQYLEKAVEFEAFAATSSNEAMRKRFSDIAACYRLLAEERKRLIATGVIPPETFVGSSPSAELGTAENAHQNTA